MLSSWNTNGRTVHVAVHNEEATTHSVEVEVTEDATGIVTVYIRQLDMNLDPVIVKMCGPQTGGARSADKVAATREA